ncbi:MAG TPA: ABC transporter ATP-binding protein [Paucimonas sp.]|nr:ABC transporter ATP-binding protein [Paucimonas sp.]HJW55994.1 ABC transporter ATP-binding protein [Burkholderiaceae bacterium]
MKSILDWMSMKLLEIECLRAGYGQITALFDVDLTLEAGETIALIGANGAGKTTLLRAVTGLIRAVGGAIRFQGQAVSGLPAHAIAALGIAMVPEGRRLFPSLTVEENLLMGACSGRHGPWTLERIYTLFPVLRERRAHAGTMLSGGQQQMVAVGRALMSNPRLLLCDELSLGLAPTVVKDIYRTLASVCGEGISLIIVEQDVTQAIQASDRYLCMREGRIVLGGTRAEADRTAISHAYFGS